MNLKRLTALILSAVLCVCLMPLSAMAAASPQVEMYEGERTVFVSSFGKMSYNGHSYTCFKTFGEAFEALGKEGGCMIITGTMKMADVKDIPGRKGITVIGTGSLAMSNLLDFSGMGDVKLEGDLTLTFVNIRLDENAYLYTNGYALSTSDDFDTYHTVSFVDGAANIINYVAPPSVAVGQVDKDCYAYLDAGTYTSFSAGSVNGLTVNGSTNMELGGGNIDLAVAGNIGNGTTNGDPTLVVGGGKIKKLVAGSSGGTVNGNVTTVIGGGSIKEAVIGAENGAVINGSVVVALNGGEFATSVKAGSGTVTGKKIVITGSSTIADIDAGAVDYLIRIEDGLCSPQFNGDAVNGFRITDAYGIPMKKIVLNGAEVASENGIYALNEGTSSIKVTPSFTLDVKTNAEFVKGYEDGTFLPQNNMTRAEAITLLTRLICNENDIKGYITANYKDVAAGAWYEPYIGLFQNLGFLDLLSLDHGLRIASDQKITRAEFTHLIYQVANVGMAASSTKLVSFSDVKKDNPYNGGINYTASVGIVTGYEDGTFRPDNLITRAEVVTMVNRLLGREPTGVAGNNSFSDIADHWACGQILAACNAENVSWVKKEQAKSYVVTGTTTEEEVKGLYEQSASLSASAIRDGVDVIAENMKKRILNTTDKLDSNGVTVYYISEKNGNDDNDGKSPEKAWKTLAAANSKIRLPKPGTLVLFERGGIYRGTIALINGVSFGAYGEGPKPLLMQSRRNYAAESLWVETDYPNVWKCTLKITNAGVIGFDHDLFDYSNDSYNETYGWIMNKGIAGFTGDLGQMNKDLQFYNELKNGVSSPGDLYLYSTEGNPGKRFKSIEIGERINIFSGSVKNSVIDNLAFKFTGAHAVGSGNAQNLTVQNCVFSWLGGSLLSESFYGGAPVNYGNAVETGICDGYYVRDCWMYQIYDTAVTHQCSAGSGSRIQKNVEYSGNLMEYVHWGIEFYNSPEGANAGDIRYTEGVRDRYNVLRMGGYGWGSIVRFRQTGALLYCGSAMSENRDEITEYNIFDRCAGYLLHLPANAKEIQDKNIYIQTIGCTLGKLRGSDYVCGYDAAERIRDKWGDQNAVVIVIDPQMEDPSVY